MPKNTAQELFERHHLTVFRFLRRLCGSQPRAEDLTQEVFLRAVRSLDRLAPASNEVAWLLRIARNLWIDRQRARARRPHRVERPTKEASTDATPGLRLDLDQALAKVPEIERQAFLMREVGGLSYVEIGTLLDLSAAAVRSRIFRARRTLRSSLRPAAQHSRKTGGTDD